MPAPLSSHPSSPHPLPPLRPVTDADGAGLARLIAACFAEYEGCLYEPAEFPELVAPASDYAARGAELWVMAAENVGPENVGPENVGPENVGPENVGRGHSILGSVAITPVPSQAACEITKVYLDARLRGSGAGEALLAHGAARAAALGFPDLVLWTDTRFARAHGFYEKLGFVKRPVIRYLADVSKSWEYRYERRACSLPAASGGRARRA